MVNQIFVCPNTKNENNKNMLNTAANGVVNIMLTVVTSFSENSDSIIYRQIVTINKSKCFWLKLHILANMNYSSIDLFNPLRTLLIFVFQMFSSLVLVTLLQNLPKWQLSLMPPVNPHKFQNSWNVSQRLSLPNRN